MWDPKSDKPLGILKSPNHQSPRRSGQVEEGEPSVRSHEPRVSSFIASLRSAFTVRSRHSSFVARGFTCFRRLASALWEHSDQLWAKCLSWTIIIVLVYVMLFAIFIKQKDGEMLWNGELFRLLAMLLGAHLVGLLTKRFLKVPALIGMMLTGCVLRNVGFYHPGVGKYSLLTRTLKQLATTVGMVKAGMRLVPDAIYVAQESDSGVQVVGLGVLPSVVEAVVTAGVTFVALGYPPIWSVCIGFLLCANSPSVIMPPMSALTELGYGEEKKIGSLVHGAAGLDVAFSVSIFDICLGMLFNENFVYPAHTVAFGTMDITMDLFGGFVFGMAAGLVPVKDDWLAVWKRLGAVVAGGMIAIVSGPTVGFMGTGPLSCICTAFVASMIWKLQRPLSAGSDITSIIHGAWIVLCPMLFAFAGSDVDMWSEYLSFRTWVWIAIIVVVSITMRLVTCFLVLWGSEFNWKEVLFIGLIFQGKATNQAALAPQILYKALDSEQKDNHTVLEIAHVSQAMAAIFILVCTPLAHLGAKLGGPCLLTRKQRRTHRPTEHISN